jgi:hypothetical protein
MCMSQFNVNEKCLLTVLQFLIGTKTVLSADSFIKYIIRQMEGVKFTYDWHLRSCCPGIKKLKSDFVLKSFQNFTSHQNLQQYGNTEEEVAYTKAFTAVPRNKDTASFCDVNSQTRKPNGQHLFRSFRAHFPLSLTLYHSHLPLLHNS